MIKYVSVLIYTCETMQARRVGQACYD
uniref:Uncharacterized protein n=1 Tax=Anguilla anguilla TaxID=7936 RepID=A0A0E9U2Q2_ANGAN